MAADIEQSFPRSAEYRALRERAASVVREPRPDAAGFAFTERHLQCVWYDDAYRPSPLLSTDGEEITVRHPGRWNLEAGPDFMDAVFSVGTGRRRVRGDVEVHVRPSDWAAHGHADDPRYAGVKAHVTYEPGTVSPGRLPAGALQVPLRDLLAADRSFSFDLLDVASYPYGKLPAEAPPCSRVLASWPMAAVERFLEAAGEERLRIKALRMADAIETRGPDQTLYESVMGALGYKHNQAPFRELARRVPLASLRSEAGGDPGRAYSLLLGVSGLLPASMSPKWEPGTRKLVRQTWDLWWKQKEAWDRRVMDKAAWRRSGTRPQNHPVRRLAAAAAFFTSPEEPSQRLPAPGPDPRTFVRGIRGLFEETSMDFWKRRLSLGGRVQDRDVHVLGPERVASILANVFIPFLAARGVRMDGIVSVLPAEHHNELLRRTATALFGPDHNPAFYRSGIRQQGILQVFHDFCIHNRSACSECRLVPALESASHGNA